MPQPPPHQPERSCVACRHKRPKRDLLRIALGTDGRLTIDLRRRAPGRGAYLCPSAACWERAAAGQQLSAALRTDLNDADRSLLQAGPPLPATTPTTSEAGARAR